MSRLRKLYEILIPQSIINDTSTHRIVKSKKRVKSNNQHLALLEFTNIESLRLNDINHFENQNINVTGLSGSGKTFTITKLIKTHFTVSNPKIIIIDQKDDYSSRGLNITSFPKDINAKQFIIGEERLPVNPIAFIEGCKSKKDIRDIVYSISNMISAINQKMGGVQHGELREMLTM